MRFIYVVWSLWWLLPGAAPGQPVIFNADSAFAHIRYLAEEIGPRPMGSRNERVALAWAAGRFRAFGADTAYVMPFYGTGAGNLGLNTTSGIAVGVFAGREDSIIVIGGHIDSSGPEIPGANDDASGTACVIELARVWSQRPRHYTLLFAAFGGEEGNLVGSRYFVEHFPNLDRVALMLQIDMAGSDDPLTPFFEVNGRQAPRWLLEDAYAFDSALRYHALSYPVSFFSLNSALGDGAGSDHMPFLEKNIPAIDFTAGLDNSPIHTQQDRLAHISKPMLARSGRLVHAMLEKYDRLGIPPQGLSRYLLLEVFGGRIYMPALLFIAMEVLAVFLGLLAFKTSRDRRQQLDKEERVRFSGFKLFTLLIMTAIVAQLGEALLQLLKGVRYPWAAAYGGYLWLFAVWAIAGLWIAARMISHWRLSSDPYVYAKRALVSLFIFTALFLLLSARLALHPASSLLLFSLAVLIPGNLAKFILGVLAPVPLLQLFVAQPKMIGHTLMQAGMVIDTFGQALLYSMVFTVILVLLGWPLVFSAGYTVARVPLAQRAGKIFRSKPAGIAIALAVIVYSGYLYALPAYNDVWKAQIVTRARFDCRTGASRLQLVSNEYLRAVEVSVRGGMQRLNSRSHAAELPFPFEADWLSIAGDAAPTAGGETVAIDWSFISHKPMYALEVDVQPDTFALEVLEANFKHIKSGKGVRFIWRAEPPDTVRLSARLRCLGSALVRTVEASYTDMPLPVHVQSAIADVQYRTIVTSRDTLSLGE